MKKIFLLFISLAVLTSCSNDDDNTNEDDQILGIWYVTEVNNANEFQLSDCNANSYVNFMSDKTAESEFFEATEADCTSQGVNGGSWSNNGSSKYTFNVPGFGVLTGSVDFTTSSSFTFYPDVLASLNTNIVFQK